MARTDKVASELLILSGASADVLRNVNRQVAALDRGPGAREAQIAATHLETAELWLERAATRRQTTMAQIDAESRRAQDAI